MHPSARMQDPEVCDLEFVTMKEAAEICRLKRTDQIRAAIKRRELTPYRISGRHVLISKLELMRWLIRRRGRRVSKNGSWTRS